MTNDEFKEVEKGWNGSLYKRARFFDDNFQCRRCEEYHLRNDAEKFHPYPNDPDGAWRRSFFLLCRPCFQKENQKPKD